MIISFTAHWMACCWGMVANADWLEEDELTWFDLLESEGQDPELVEDSFGQYLIAVYFAVMTLTTV